MKHFEQFAGGLALALLCLFLYDADRTAVDVRCEIPMAVEKLNAAAAAYNTHGQQIADETLDLIGSANQLIANVNKAALKLPKLMDNLNTTTGKLPALVDSGTRAANSAADVADKVGTQATAIGASTKTAIDSIPPLMAAGTKTVADAGTAVTHIDKAVSDSNIPLIASHVQGMTASGDSILKDGARVVHEKTAPESKTQRVLSGAKDWLLWILEATFYAHAL
jgi:hypothetical protein